MRLNRFLAAAGLGSRRSCERLILDGAVQVNGEVCRELSTQVGDNSVVLVNGRKVLAQKQVFLAMYKPRGILCTATDERGRRTIFDFLPPDLPRVFYIGRLDMDSEGLLLLTNNGELAERISRPGSHVEKEYIVTLDREFDPAHTGRLRKGFMIREEKPGGRLGRLRRAAAVSVEPLGGHSVRVVLDQGLKRQLRLMFSFLGYKVKGLKRVRIGGVRLGGLKPGEWRHLTPRDLASLDQEATNEPRNKAKNSTGKHR